MLRDPKNIGWTWTCFRLVELLGDSSGLLCSESSLQLAPGLVEITTLLSRLWRTDASIDLGRGFRNLELRAWSPEVMRMLWGPELTVTPPLLPHIVALRPESRSNLVSWWKCGQLRCLFCCCCDEDDKPSMSTSFPSALQQWLANLADACFFRSKAATGLYSGKSWIELYLDSDRFKLVTATGIVWVGSSQSPTFSLVVKDVVYLQIEKRF